MGSMEILSGGQTGVDRAALDFALKKGIPCGGWCPRGRIAEDGIIPPYYPLTETPSSLPEQRTEWNVRDGDFTLILHRGELSGGTRYTWECAERLGKPYAIVLLPGERPLLERIVHKILALKIRRINIAGPRESKAPGIYEDTLIFLEELFRMLSGGKEP
jgi:hypothetical protein